MDASMDWVGCSGCSRSRRIETRPADSMTLASLRKVNNYPFYMMRYYGEYSLPAAHALEGGTAAAPVTVDIGAGGFYACTCFAVLGGDTTRLLSRNFDWYDHVPLLLLQW